jgi:hypothetical protein
MYKVLKADKDAYITNRHIGSSASESIRKNANVGAAGSLDLFKLFGATLSSGSIPNLELSRLLIHFDLQPLRDLFDAGKINVNSNSFNCKVKLFDVYGGQTTPNNFDISLFPLSASFDEGNGRDVVYYSDYDICNFLTSSIAHGAWIVSGCGKGGSAEETCDYITASISLGINNFEVKQHFSTGEEDLEIDITTIMSATLANVIPDNGYRISFSSSQESDAYSYFVKRFASRSAYNTSKHPRIIVRYNDSLQDDTQLLKFDENSSIFMRNYSHGEPSNILSGSSLLPVSGSNCVILRLETIRSNGSGSYNIYFTGSQHYDGLNYTTGLYSASFLISQSDNVLKAELLKSGSVIFTPTWISLDGTAEYLTGDDITVYPPQRSSSAQDFKNYVVTTTGIQELHRSNENVFVRVNIFDYTSPFINFFTKVPAEPPGLVVRNAHYQIRDSATNEIVVPFDEKYDSTRISSDANGMYFILDASNLTVERGYFVDIMIATGGTKRIFKAVSNVFNVSDTQTG